MFNFIVSDLDGTLLSPSHKLTSFTKKIIKSIFKLGINFVIASGRHHIDVSKICNNLNINAYMITSNGAKIHDKDGKLIFSYNLNKDVVYFLLKVANKDLTISTNVFYKNEWLVNRKNVNYNNFLYESNFQYKFHNLCDLSYKDVYKIHFLCQDYNKLLNLKKDIELEYNNFVNVDFSSNICLEVVANGISKGSSLKFLIKKLGYKLSDCISFGDGMNDLDMLSITGKGCIMENASMCLKKSLPTLEIIGNNKDDAVANFLYSMFIKK